jgi:hypothetical protein
MSAVAEVLDAHTRSLPLDDAAAAAERDAYDDLVRRHRALAGALHATAESMRARRDLAIAPHDEALLADARSREGFERYVAAKADLLALLQASIEEDRAMLRELAGGPA